jgi:hypothetical protein
MRKRRRGGREKKMKVSKGDRQIPPLRFFYSKSVNNETFFVENVVYEAIILTPYYVKP